MTRTIKRARLLVTFLAAISLLLPAAALARNGVEAHTKCTWTTGSVGQTNQQGGSITYTADDFWNPKTGHYYTAWQKAPFNQPVFNWGDAPHGGWYVGYDPNFGRYSWLQYGSFTVWGTATKTATTKSTAIGAYSSALVSTTTGVGHTWDDYARCSNSSGWVKINS